MKHLDMQLVLECALLPSERNRTGLFVKQSTEETAVTLWKQYASGGAGTEAESSALSMHNMTQNMLEDYCRSVRLRRSLSEYLGMKDFRWLALLDKIVSHYWDGVQKYEAFFSSCIFPGGYTFCRAIYPFYYELYCGISETCPWDRETVLHACTAFTRTVEQIGGDVFLVSAKKHFQSQDVSAYYGTNEPVDDASFIGWLYNGGIVDVIQCYPVCFRLICQAILRYIENLKIMCQRIAADQPLISKALLDGKPAERIRGIDFCLSDFHNNGQSVAVIEFESGVRIVYKPRSTAIDAAWNRFLSLFQRAAGIQFAVLTVINRGKYGYVAFAERIPSKDIAAYYRNAGSLLCLCSLFGATDLHYENIVAQDVSPVVVDLETIISPRPKGKYAMIEADKLSSHTINVARTLLLPRWIGTSAGLSCEIGGFSSTMDMGRNYHTIDGIRTSADQYPEEFLDGFSQAYHFILCHKDEVESMLHSCGFENCNYRYVFRRTALYSKLQSHFLHAAFLKSGADYRAVVTRLGAGVLLAFDAECANLLWPIEQSEEAAVLRGDIPYFFCRGNSKTIFDCYGPLVDDFLEATPIDVVLKNLSEMTEDRFAYEFNFIRKSLTLSRCQPRETKTTELVSYRDIRRDRQSSSKKTIVQETERLHQALSEYSIDGLRFSYYAPVRDPQTTRYNLSLLENTFYSGIWGVLLFHGAYARWKHDSELRQLVLDKSERIIDELLNREDESNYLRIGLADGIAGSLRGMICLSQILGDRHLLNHAVALALRIKEQYLERCKQTDLFGGLAGFLYVASQLWLLTQDSRLLPQIQHTADLLKRKATMDTRTNCRVWTGKMEYAPLTGLAHGQAGYIIALALAWNVLHDDELVSLVDQGRKYEELNYNARANNWFDFRKFMVSRRGQDTSPDYQERFMFGTCSGTPGIGLSRIALSEYLPACEDKQIIGRAIDFCSHQPLVGCDSYCCGTMGWVDFLIESSGIRKDTQFIGKAQEIATSVIPEISQERYILSNLRGIYDVSLFTGISGIGYEMIRTQIPEHIPSPILFHLPH